MPFSEEQITKLEADLDGACVQSRSQGGKTLSYIEGWKAIETANKIFGFDGWSHTTEEMVCLFDGTITSGSPPKEKGFAVYRAKVRVTVGDRHHDGSGYGSGFGKYPGEAHEGAIKEAETDALKRALRHWGYQLGLALYDKAQEHVTKAEGVTDAGAEGAGDDAGPESDDEW